MTTTGLFLWLCHTCTAQQCGGAPLRALTFFRLPLENFCWKQIAAEIWTFSYCHLWCRLRNARGHPHVRKLAYLVYRSNTIISPAAISYLSSVKMINWVSSFKAIICIISCGPFFFFLILPRQKNNYILLDHWFWYILQSLYKRKENY